MKKWTSLICAVAILITLLPGITMPVNAATESGQCGDNLTWKYQGSTLTISGTGPMYDYSEENRPPWYNYKGYINYLVIEPGVTSIGDYAFDYFRNCRNPAIPASITSIGKRAFANVYLKSTLAYHIYFEGDAPEIAEDAFYNTKVNCYTQNWSEESKQNYGGTITWGDMEIWLDEFSSNRLVELGEDLKVEDIVWRYRWFNILAQKSSYPRYIPRECYIGPYDNSTCGVKTVTITIDGLTFDYTYFVTDGISHLEAIEISIPQLPDFCDNSLPQDPIITMWGVELSSDYYTIKRTRNEKTLTGTLTVTGKNICEGFQQTVYFPLLKVDLCDSGIGSIGKQNFLGYPLEDLVRISADSGLKKNESFIEYYANNINVGTATAYAVGIGNCYGNSKEEFQIDRFETSIVLKGNKIGTVNEELSDDIYIDQMVLTPSKFVAETGVGTPHKVAYDLYKLKGEDYVLVDQKVITGQYSYSTLYTYDFSSIYNGSVDKGGEVFVLSYSWVTQYGDVYAGMMYLIVPAKVTAATSMTMTRIEDQDYQWEYLSVAGDDGVLGDIQWTSSDSSIAVVDGGVVTMKKPGTATITAKCGNLVASQTVSASLQDLSEGRIFDYFEDSGAIVLWDNRLLTEGTDYVLTVTGDENGVTVTATGIGWFTGELMKTFAGMEHLTDPNPHTHGFDNSCDSTCNGCDFTRDRDHTFSTEWSKDLEIHYHECTACGEKKDVAEHILTENGKECTVCGRLWTPGDIDGNGAVNRDDVIALLLHVSMPAAFPISIPADYNGDGLVTRDDVIQLLLHVSMPDAFPLQ